MKKYKLTSNKINWPHKCAYCNEKSYSFINTRSKAIKKFEIFILFNRITTQFIEITFPVCKEHKLKATIASKLSQRNQLYLGLGFIATFCLMMPFADVYALICGLEFPKLSGRIFGYGFPTIYWAIYFWAKNNAPLIIEDLNNEVYICFKNEAFADSFENVNKIV